MFLVFFFLISERLSLLTEIHCSVTFRILVSIIAILLYIIRSPLKIQVVYFHPINTNWVYISCRYCARCWGRPRWIIMVPALGELPIHGGKQILMWLMVIRDIHCAMWTHAVDWGSSQHFWSAARSHNAQPEHLIKDGLAVMGVCRLHSKERNEVKVFPS